MTSNVACGPFMHLGMFASAIEINQCFKFQAEKQTFSSFL